MKKKTYNYHRPEIKFFEFKIVCNVLGTTPNNMINKLIDDFMESKKRVLERAIIRDELRRRKDDSI